MYMRHYASRINENSSGKYRPQLVTILPDDTPTSGSPKQFQRLATDRTCPAVKNRPKKMEVGLERKARIPAANSLTLLNWARTATTLADLAALAAIDRQLRGPGN
jgi:hypothetical protein